MEKPLNILTSIFIQRGGGVGLVPLGMNPIILYILGPMAISAFYCRECLEEGVL